MTYTFTAKNGTTVDVPEDYLSGWTLADPGYCLHCAAERGGCEPDARRYECEDCGKMAVYGAQELLLMGLIG